MFLHVYSFIIAPVKLNSTCFGEWHGHNRNWGFIHEFLIFLTSHMQSNSRVYQLPFHTLLSKTPYDPAPGHFSYCSSNLSSFVLIYSNCPGFQHFSNLSSSLLTQSLCTCFSICLELSFPKYSYELLPYFLLLFKSNSSFISLYFFLS